MGPQERQRAAQVVLRPGVLAALHVLASTAAYGIPTTRTELTFEVGWRVVAALHTYGVIELIPTGKAGVHCRLTAEGHDLMKRVSIALGDE